VATLNKGCRLETRLRQDAQIIKYHEQAAKNSNYVL